MYYFHFLLQMYELIKNSFLDDNLKNKYEQLINERINRIKI